MFKISIIFESVSHELLLISFYEKNNERNLFRLV